MTNTLRLLSLCSGIGGADLAAEWTGAITVAGQVEIDPFCQHILAKHWPHVPRKGDIREVRGDEFGDIDITVAGFPCQPHSLAGKRKGSSDERNLWPEVKRLLSTIKPRWFVGENVPGLLSVEDGRFYGSILADLDALGYRCAWGVYGAGEVGAPHQRERIFLVAYLSRIGSNAWGAKSTERAVDARHSLQWYAGTSGRHQLSSTVDQAG